MPELPEVQTVVNDLIAQGCLGKTIKRARVNWPKTIAAPAKAAFIRRIKNKKITAIRRRGKFIVLKLAPEQNLCIHLRMTGRLHLSGPGEAPDSHDRVILFLDDSHKIHFHDTRKFGRMYLVKDAETIIGGLGPEPLDKTFTPAILADRIGSSARMLKPRLLDQATLAGLGNIYVDESLWRARLHPRQIASGLTYNQIRSLHKAIKDVLYRGIKNRGTTLGAGQTNFYSVGRRRGQNQEQLNVFRRTGAPCKRCGTAIKRIIVGQRSTHICPKCQKII